jgi:hypothetical protein
MMKNIFPKGKTLKILEDTDILQGTDLCRLVIETSREGGFDLTYKSDSYLPLAWHEVKDEMRMWIGYEINEYSYKEFYEFARIIN